MRVARRRLPAAVGLGAAAMASAMVRDPVSEGGAGSSDVVPVVFEYRLSDWSECTDACGIGTQERSLECFVTITTAGHSRTRLVDMEKCVARDIDPPTEPRSKQCFGSSPVEEFCSSCPVELRGCRECAAGFDLHPDGTCKNEGIEVLLSVRAGGAGAPGVAWQKAWRPRLEECMTALVETAGNITGSRVSVYSVAPIDGVARERRLGDDSASAARDFAMLGVSTAVPQGMQAAELRDSLASRFASAFVEVGSSICPESLKLESASVLLPGGRRADAVARGMPLGAWIIITLTVVMLGIVFYFIFDRRYRKREETVLAHRAAAAGLAEAGGGRGRSGAAPGGRGRQSRDVQLQER